MQKADMTAHIYTTEQRQASSRSSLARQLHVQGDTTASNADRGGGAVAQKS